MQFLWHSVISAMARGKKTGGGSRKGKPNKVSAHTREALWAYCTSKGLDPFTFLVDTMGNRRVKRELRVQCARELATYLQPRLKQVEVSLDEPTRTALVHRYGSPRSDD